MVITFVQPALPAYRVDFFRRVAAHFGDGINVYYSPVDMGAITADSDLAYWQTPIGPMKKPLRGIEWQVGTFLVPIKKDDIVVVCGAPRNLSTLLLLVRARVKGAQTIWWGQYWSATTKMHRHWLRMKLSRLADALLFYTDDEVTRFYIDGWSHPGPVGALNNGLDMTEVRQLRRPYIAEKRGRDLLFIGRLTGKAQLGLLVAALAEPALAGAHLHVIGDGVEEQALRALASAQCVADRITWHGGTTNEAKIAEVANRCAAFVYPGQVGLSLIHAMGYGLPCVVHDQPQHHMPEIAAFEAGATGETFKEGDSNSLALTIASLMNAGDLRCRMSERCRVVTEHDYTTQGMATRFIAFVDDMGFSERTKKE